MKKVNGVRLVSGYLTLEVSKMLDITLRRLQRMDEIGLVSPDHELYRRSYKEKDLIEIAIVQAFRNEKKFLVRSIRKILKLVRRKYRRLKDAIRFNRKLYAVTDRGCRKLSLQTNPKRVTKLLLASSLPLTAVCITDCALAAQKAIAKHRR